ncbi:hypothetical protein D1869_04905 [Sulfurisphaera ohwakuensis]|uniref:Uncharacterized protein n=2 Tax=Sulfurisphaera ohwakuensis TaxID=69656 RepID=A0A650CG01_SULOH|nr:hypothetical protein [Sulfurisphaera ohwakuensis]QGR16605.1 hypothetical protein D1869_04905 [Sulfurisphaera ohwakuensis]
MNLQKGAYYFIVFIGFLASIPLSILNPLKVSSHYLPLYLVVNIIIANFIVFTFIYFIMNNIKLPILLIPWLFISSLIEFYIGMSAIMENLSVGYFTVLLIFLEFYGMLYFAQRKSLYLGIVYIVILAFIEILVYDKM